MKFWYSGNSGNGASTRPADVRNVARALFAAGMAADSSAASRREKSGHENESYMAPRLSPIRNE